MLHGQYPGWPKAVWGNVPHDDHTVNENCPGHPSPTPFPLVTEAIPNLGGDAVQAVFANAPNAELAISDATATVAGVSAHCNSSSDLHTFAVTLAGGFAGGLLTILIMAGMFWRRMRTEARREAKVCREKASVPGKDDVGARSADLKE